MKTIEQKAKAYDEAINKIMDYRKGNTKMYSDVNKAIDYLFPELKESEDEKMRKKCIELIKELKTFCMHDGQNECIAWLEKQGEQKKKQYQIYESTKDRFYKEGVEDGILIGIKKQNPAWSEEK